MLIRLRECAGWSTPLLFTNSPKTGVLASRQNFIHYPESDLIKIKEITLLRDWILPGLGRISILCLQGGKGIEENLTISDN